MRGKRVITYENFEPEDDCLVEEGTLGDWRTEAWFSHDEAYRYSVWYMWDTTLAPLLAVMLNPSTATHLRLDPTLTGMSRRAQRWGYGSLVVMNLFALRSTDPKALYSHPDPVGPLNDIILKLVMGGMLFEGGSLFAGWGAHGTYLNRHVEFARLAREVGVERVHCLHTTKDNQPGHPLYLKQDAALSEWMPFRYQARPRPRP